MGVAQGDRRACRGRGGRAAPRAPRLEAARALHAHPHGEHDGKADWLVFHKRDDDAVEGWDPEDHPRVGAERSDQRRGRGGADTDLDPRGRAAARRAPARVRAADARRAGRAGRARGQGHVDVPGTRPRAHESRQGAVSAAWRRRGHQARPRAVRRVHRAHDAAVSSRAPAEPPPVSRRRGPARLLAEAGSGTRARLDPALAQRVGRRGGEQRVPDGRRAAGPRLARQPRRARAAPVDEPDRGGRPADVRARRHRSRARHRLGRRRSGSRSCTGPRSTTSEYAAIPR